MQEGVLLGSRHESLPQAGEATSVNSVKDSQDMFALAYEDSHLMETLKFCELLSRGGGGEVIIMNFKHLSN